MNAAFERRLAALESRLIRQSGGAVLEMLDGETPIEACKRLALTGDLRMICTRKMLTLEQWLEIAPAQQAELVRQSAAALPPRR